MTAPLTLADQLVALCAEHGLNALSVDVHIQPDGSHFFGSFAHKGGKCGSASTMRHSTSAVVGGAITDVLAECGQSLIDVPELEAAA